MRGKRSVESLFDRILYIKNCEKVLCSSEMKDVDSLIGDFNSPDFNQTSLGVLITLAKEEDCKKLKELIWELLFRERIKLSDQLISALKRLPVDEKDVLFSLYFKGMTVNEVAEAKEKSKVWVRQQRQRAFARLNADDDF